MKIFFDGGCRPNPGSIEIAVVARGITYLAAAVGHGSNTDAEWLAAIHALEIAARLGVRDVMLVGDSMVVVDQASGVARCRGTALNAHLMRFRDLAAGFDRVRIRHIRRAQNLAGIALERTHGRL